MTAELIDFTVRIDTGRWSETVLRSIDLQVPDRQITALLGESGCGKSMVARALTGHLPGTAASSGEVRVGGSARALWEDGRIGYLPQAGIEAFAAGKGVGGQLRERAQRFGRWSVERACEAARYPVEMSELNPDQHSGGQIQRAALAAALLSAPSLLVVDEPTESLDTETGVAVWRTLRKYADSGPAVLTITQNVQMLVALAVADRIVVMREGWVVAAGPAGDVARLDEPYVQGFFRPFGR
ncbi:ATP-binding cassette domain-containing protein [Nocardia callitridis]|uniref:ABC transporter domain-containing protein n=1 Tax=Nocardia callitridis TaxID=648753 RepID=A0ABP9KZE1_9NOCA